VNDSLSISDIKKARGVYRSIRPDGSKLPPRRRLATAMRDAVYDHRGLGVAQGGVRVTLSIDTAILMYPDAVDAGYRLVGGPPVGGAT